MDDLFSNNTTSNSTCIIWKLHETLQTTTHYAKEQHADNEFLIPLFLTPIGVLLAFMGFRIIKPSLMIISGFFGLLLFLHAGASRKHLISCEASAIGAFVVALVFAFISRAILQMALFISGAFAGGALTHYIFVIFPELEETYKDSGIIFEHSLIPYWISVFIVGIVFGISTVKYQKKMIKIVTSAIGGLLVSTGMSTIYDDMYWVSVVVGISITAAGFIIQWKEYNPCRRTKEQRRQRKNDQTDLKV